MAKCQDFHMGLQTTKVQPSVHSVGLSLWLVKLLSGKYRTQLDSSTTLNDVGSISGQLNAKRLITEFISHAKLRKQIGSDVFGFKLFL